MASGAGRGGRHGRPVAVLAAVALTAAAFALRWRALPGDGLLFDDAWVSLGATRGSPADLLAVSTMHPGFTALLMAWDRLTPAGTTWTVLPVLVAGALTPAVLVWALRRLDVRLPVAVGAGVLAVVAPTHVVYSGRVKPYALEAVAILLLALGLGPLARRRWRAATGVGWVALALAFSTVNAFAFAAVAVAAMVLALHPEGDRPVRLAAAAAQAAGQAALLAAERRSFDYDALSADWGGTFDGYVELSADPVASVGELGEHLGRVGQVVVVDAPLLALGLVVAGLAGLVVEATRGRHRVVARYLLALPAVALAGAVVERFPFGTIDQTPLFPGTRASLWLLPSVLVGTAWLTERGVAARHHAGRAVALVAVGVAGAVVVVLALGHDVTYPAPGAETAHGVLEGRTGDDLVLVTEIARWSLAAVDGSPFELAIDPAAMVGFDPVPTDATYVMVDPRRPWTGSTAERQLVAEPPERAFVVNGMVGVFDEIVVEVERSLAQQGFRRVDVEAAGTFEVHTWSR